MKQKETIKTYRTMDEKALEKELADLERKLTETRLKVYANKSSNFSEIGKIRRNIARLSTIKLEMRPEKL